MDKTNYRDLLIGLVNWAASSGMIVTAAPYDDSCFLIGVLPPTSNSGQNQFAWWNLQTYGGADYSVWVDCLSSAGIVAQPESFLVPGYKVQPGTTPGNVQSTLQHLEGSYPSLTGSFIWNYELINQYGYTASEFASAIRAGLEGQ